MEVRNRQAQQVRTDVEVPRPREAAEAVTAGESPLVVLVDGSASSVEALVWALRHALEEDRSVRVVTAWPLSDRVFVGEVPGHFNEARWEAAQAQARAIAHARSRVPEVPRIDRDLVNATALDVVLALARPDAVIVLGTDRDDRTPTDPRSLTGRAQARASGPVILVPVRPD